MDKLFRLHSPIQAGDKKGFTLIELLIVIAIIAVLAVVVVLVLNPAELLKQSRDANRLSDLSTLSDAVNLYSTDQSGSTNYTLGFASDTYLSVPDPTATSTNQCAGLGMALAPSSYVYHCSSSNTYRNVNASGWTPVNFSALSAGSPISSLPVDSINQTSSDLYYTYQTTGSQYEVTASMESQKYARIGSTNGGLDPTLTEMGSGVAAIPSVGRGLIGYWPLDEGGGNTIIDWSGNGDTGIWGGTQAGSSTYYGNGKINQWAGYFNGSNNYVGGPGSVLPNLGSNANATIMAWINPSSLSGVQTVFSQGASAICFNDGLTLYGSSLRARNSSNDWALGGAITTGIWQQVAVVFSPSQAQGFINGAAVGTNSSGVTTNCTNTNFAIGTRAYNATASEFFSGEIADVRLYARALSPSEIQAIYNAEK